MGATSGAETAYPGEARVHHWFLVGVHVVHIQLYVMFLVPCCYYVRYKFRVKTMFSSSILASVLKPFLADLEQCVLVNGSKSKPSEVHLGIPQGTVPGPILFLVHISDISEKVTSDIRFFI